MPVLGPYLSGRRVEKGGSLVGPITLYAEIGPFQPPYKGKYLLKTGIALMAPQRGKASISGADTQQFTAPNLGLSDCLDKRPQKRRRPLPQ